MASLRRSWQEWREQRPETTPTAKDPRFDGADWQPRDRRDLAILEPLHIAQRDQQPQVGRQLRQGLIDHPAAHDGAFEIFG